MSNAKNIANFPEYRAVSISRDLTYKQRQELYLWRQARKQPSNANERPNTSNTLPVPLSDNSQQTQA